jgi:hypothetical protein
MDVHTATISVAVLDAAGKLIMESILETKASTILQFIHGLRGDVYITFEEGTLAAWLYDLLKPYVTNIVVCDPRRNALLNEGSKSDRIDARKLAELLPSNLLRGANGGPCRAEPSADIAANRTRIATTQPTRIGRSGGSASDAGRSFGEPQVGDAARGSAPAGPHGFENWRLPKRLIGTSLFSDRT